MQMLITRARTITSVGFAVNQGMLMATAQHALSKCCAIFKDEFSTQLHSEQQSKANKAH